jgi:NitT/TauT family transport system substrate-binding protein
MAVALRLLLSLILVTGLTLPAFAQKPSFTVGWSVYVGWNPYYYMAKSGILRKWANKYGIAIKAQRFDYAASIDAFVAGNVDACAMTNMEALDLPAASGIDTTAVIVGDYSNGNDVVFARNGATFKTLAGKRVLLVQKTVSEYLFERGMVLNGMESQLKQVKLVNTSDSDIVTAYMSDASATGVVTWKPLASQVAKMKGVTPLFNSSQVPGEILDLAVVRTDVLNRADGSGQKFAKALTGAWYETLAQMSGPNADKVLTVVAEAGQDTLASYKEQLATTKLFYKPAEALEMTHSAGLKEKMALVRQFCFTHGLLGKNVASPDDVAIRYADGSVQGKKERVRLRFETSYMQMAGEGKL